LALKLKPCSSEALSIVAPSGQPWDAVQLEEAEAILPFSITDIEESDVLGEDTVNQYVLTTSNGWRITFRHIFPPMMVGISLESTGGAPNKSFKADAVNGADLAPLWWTVFFCQSRRSRHGQDSEAQLRSLHPRI
jgi:hypothetical protein